MRLKKMRLMKNSSERFCIKAQKKRRLMDFL